MPIAVEVSRRQPVTHCCEHWLCVYVCQRHWRQPRRGHIPPIFGWGDVKGNIPPILLRTFGYSRPILVALRSLSLNPISFGYKTPPIRFSQAGGQSAHKARPPNLQLALTPLVSERISETTFPIFITFCACYIWPWLDPSPAALQCVETYVLSVVWITSYLNRPDHMAYVAMTISLQRVISLRRRAHANVPPSLYWSRPGRWD